MLTYALLPVVSSSLLPLSSTTTTRLFKSIALTLRCQETLKASKA